MSADDNVIPFPGRWNPEADPTPRLPEPGRRPFAVSTFALTVRLDDCEPTVWRRLSVTSDMCLDQLHEVLQAVMGWNGSHLHQFTIGPQERDPRVVPFLSAFAEREGDDGVPERDVRLDQVLTRPGDRLHYDYDFGGDAWQHTLTLHEVLPHDSRAPRARCLAGARACPPEDCGGVDGYGDILTALAAPELADEGIRRRLEWLPEGFDPAAFSVERTNCLLAAALCLGEHPGPDGPP